jgi:phosphatidylglycerol:prolipoprotein diacylglycerol transferase
VPKKRKKPRSASSTARPRPSRPSTPPDPARSEPPQASSLRTEHVAPTLIPAARRAGASSAPSAPVPAARPEDLAFIAVPFASVADREPQALGVTYSFDAPAVGLPLGVNVRFDGRRVGASPPTERDEFTLYHELPPLPPGGGTVSLTVRALDVAGGDWTVRAEAVVESGTTTAPGTILPRAVGTGRTGFAPVVRSRAPGVVLGAWPVLVLLGVVAGLIAQVVLARHAHLPAGKTTLVLAVASVLGLIGAKAYFLVLHRDRQAPGLLQTGLAIQGFVLAAIAAAATGAAVLSIPVRSFLDVTSVGLLIGMAIGRWGCFYGGCCVGRPTSSRWGRWSSDRTLGVRRIPTQLLESAMAAVLAVLAASAVWAELVDPPGLVFVGAVASYTLGRQLLFPLRSVPRSTASGRSWVMAASGVVLVADLAMAVRG